MLTDILKEKKCFKLVCGAGNEDVTEVEKLVTLYSKAGCNFFDLCAKPEIVNAAKKGLERAGIKKDRYLCCSVGIKGDPHVSKAYIKQRDCLKCGKCKSVCGQNAIYSDKNSFKVDKIRCIGCGKCVLCCRQNAITTKFEYKDLKEVLPQIVKMGIDCIEFHVIGTNEKEVNEKWNYINSIYKGNLSICVDRLKSGNESVLKRLERMLEIRKPYTTIIQADGCPMSGGKDDYKTTLQAVAMAEIIQNSNLPVYILLSGGTNSKSSELASICGIDINGVAIGSFARKIVREYIARDDFFKNDEIFSQALDIAKKLVSTVINKQN